MDILCNPLWTGKSNDGGTVTLVFYQSKTKTFKGFHSGSGDTFINWEKNGSYTGSTLEYAKSIPNFDFSQIRTEPDHSDAIMECGRVALYLKANGKIKETAGALACVDRLKALVLKRAPKLPSNEVIDMVYLFEDGALAGWFTSIVNGQPYGYSHDKNKAVAMKREVAQAYVRHHSNYRFRIEPA